MLFLLFSRIVNWIGSSSSSTLPLQCFNSRKMEFGWPTSGDAWSTAGVWTLLALKIEQLLNEFAPECMTSSKRSTGIPQNTDSNAGNVWEQRTTQRRAVALQQSWMEKAETLSTITDCHYAFKPLLPGIACPPLFCSSTSITLPPVAHRYLGFRFFSENRFK